MIDFLSCQDMSESNIGTIPGETPKIIDRGTPCQQVNQTSRIHAACNSLHAQRRCLHSNGHGKPATSPCLASHEYEVFARSPWYIHNVMALASYLLILALSDRAQRVIRSRGLWAFSGVCLIMSSIPPDARAASTIHTASLYAVPAHLACRHRQLHNHRYPI